MFHQNSAVELNELGEAVGDYSSRSDGWRVLQPLMLTAAGSVFLISAVAGFFYPSLELSPQNLLFLLLFMLGGIGLFGLGIYLIGLIIMQGNWRIQAYNAGIVLHYKGKTRLLYWSDIHSIQQRTFFSQGDEYETTPHNTYALYTMLTTDGIKYRFSGVQIEHLFHFIRQQIATQQNDDI